MTPPPPRVPVKPSRLEGAALLLVGGPVLLPSIAWLLFDWRHTLAVLAGLGTYALLFVGLARLVGLPLSDAPPTRRHYLIAALAGAVGGLGYALILTGEFRAPSLFTGAMSGAGWLWVAHLIRAPLGARPWPPYRDVPGDAGPSDPPAGTGRP